MTTVLKAKKELMASRVSNLVTETNENLLRVNLSKFFADLEHEIQSALVEYWNDTVLLQGQLNLILAPIHEKTKEYYEILLSHKLEEFNRGKETGRRLVKRANHNAALKAKKKVPVKFTANENNLFGTLTYTEDKLEQDTFAASELTMSRVDENINQILVEGYRSGLGINHVSQQLTERFEQLRTWEAKRIARTEIHTAQNMGVLSSYESLGVEYTQWMAAHDSRTRRSHIDIDGEIIPFGGVYSNKLKYPGDKSGRIEEWINCRCSNAPFVMPAGMMAPSFSPFKESDLVPIEVESVQPTEPLNPIEANLTPDELKRYQKAQHDLEKATTQLEKLADDDPRRIMFEHRMKSAKRTIKRYEDLANNPQNREVVEEKIIKKGGKKNTDLDYNKITSNEDIADYFGFTYIEEYTTQYGKTTSRPIFRDERYDVEFRGMDNFDIVETKEVLRSYDASHSLLKKSTRSIFLDPHIHGKTLGECYTASNSITIYTHKGRGLDSNTLNSTVDHEMSHAFDNLLGSKFDKYFSQESKEYRKLVREEGWSSLYSYSTKGSTRIAEDIAETGSMVINKNNPNVRIKLQDGTIITAKEWCEKFPKKTAFFEELLNSKKAKELLR